MVGRFDSMQALTSMDTGITRELYWRLGVLGVTSRKFAVFIEGNGNWDEKKTYAAQERASPIDLEVLEQRIRHDGHGSTKGASEKVVG
jgi:hypothetical protein